MAVYTIDRAIDRSRCGLAVVECLRLSLICCNAPKPNVEGVWGCWGMGGGDIVVILK